MNQPPGVSSERDQLHATIGGLQETIRRLQEQRELLIRRRRRHLLIVGVSLSLLVHVGLMLYLNVIHRAVPAATSSQPVSLEFAVIQEPELTHLQAIEFEDVTPEEVLLDELPDDHLMADLDADVSAASLEISAAGSVPALGGSGAGEGGEATLGGGGAGTSFFGVSSRGTRFAYIVDVSGSMGQDRKIGVSMRELARSIEALPDYAYFYIVLFSSHITLPPIQRGWTRARPNTVSNVIRWLNQVDPQGGTQPKPAFLQVFSLRDRADVIFFLTDGEIPPDTLETVVGLNARGKRIVINTIAFGDPTSQDLLKEIARKSGGVYRFVPSDQW
ncbi:MAG: vWA domain-containing protein [Planctomycetota bacterium]